jgi:hypothetical protein
VILGVPHHSNDEDDDFRRLFGLCSAALVGSGDVVVDFAACRFVRYNGRATTASS